MKTTTINFRIKNMLMWLLIVAIIITVMCLASSCNTCKVCAKKCMHVYVSRVDTVTIIRKEKLTIIEKDTVYLKELKTEKENTYGNLSKKLTASTSYSIAIAWVDTIYNMLNLQIKNKDSALLPYKIIYKEIYVSDSSSNKSSQNEVIEVNKQSSWQKFMYVSGLIVWIALVFVIIFYCVKLILFIRKKISIRL